VVVNREKAGFCPGWDLSKGSRLLPGFKRLQSFIIFIGAHFVSLYSLARGECGIEGL
jgi:hypothetical protein